MDSKHFANLLAICALLISAPSRAQESLVTYKSLTPEIALDLARAALADCQHRGYQVAIAVVDRFGVISKISELSLHRATQGRTATDIDVLQTYVTNGAGALIDVVRKMRVVLETYCRTTYPTSFQPNEWLGEMVGKIRAVGDSHPAATLYSELDEINDYTSQYHHGEDMEDVTPDQIDPNELTGYARRTLRIVNALQA
jgi:hypothetical protein